MRGPALLRPGFAVVLRQGVDADALREGIEREHPAERAAADVEHLHADCRSLEVELLGPQGVVSRSVRVVFQPLCELSLRGVPIFKPRGP